jgi:hypothetical protein
VRSLAELSGVPVAHTLMGTGVLPPDHPQLLGVVGFWGSPTANRLASEADVIVAVGTRFPETDSSSWEPGVTFRIPPTRLIHIDLDPHEPGRNYPTFIAATADAGLSLAAISEAYGAPTPDRGYDWGPARRARGVPGPEPRERDLGRMASAPEHPPSPARRSRCDPRDGCRLEQERRRPAVPRRRSRLVPHARRLLHDGLRSRGRPGRGHGRDGPPRRRAGRGRSVRLEPERDRDRRGDGHRPGLGGDAQLRGRDDRRAAAEALRFRLRVRVRGRRVRVLTRLRGHRPAAAPMACTSSRRARPRLRQAVASGRPTLLDVPMRNTPVATPGAWDIERIYQVAQ